MNRDKETLVILIPGFPGSESDSVCLPAQQSFVKTLTNLYPALNIVVLSFQYPYHTRPYRWHDIPVIPFNGKNKGGIAKLFRKKRIGKTLKDIRQQNNIIGILSFWYNECAVVGKQFAEKNGLKHFGWIMGQDARSFNPDPRQLKPVPTGLIALSDFLQDEFETNHGIRPGHVIPLGVDPEKFTPFNEKGNDILAVGSLIPLKQYDIFIDIIRSLKKQIPGIKVILIGDGPEKDKLKELIQRYGLTENLTLTGELPHHEALHWMQGSKIFLHTSSYEGFSGVCLEALAAGCQVISFCRAMQHSIDHWHIVTDAEEMKKRALLLLQDDKLDHQPVIPYKMEDTVKKIMELLST